MRPNMLLPNARFFIHAMSHGADDAGRLASFMVTIFGGTTDAAMDTGGKRPINGLQV